MNQDEITRNRAQFQAAQRRSERLLLAALIAIGIGICLVLGVVAGLTEWIG